MSLILLDLNGRMKCLGKDLFLQLGSCAERVNDDENVWGFKVKALNLHFYSYLILYYIYIRQIFFQVSD